MLQEILDDLSDIKVSEEDGKGDGYTAGALIDCSGFLSCCCCCCVL
jgi:hypothetical protein